MQPSDADLAALVDGRCGDPFAVLGPHEQASVSAIADSNPSCALRNFTSLLLCGLRELCVKKAKKDHAELAKVAE